MADKLRLSQAILSPIDAILRAQVHSARSFLNLVLQMGFPHRPLDEHGNVDVQANGDDELYSLTATHKYEDDSKTVEHTINQPLLGAIPLKPLAITGGKVAFNMVMTGTEPSNQFGQGKDEKINKDKNFNKTKRPWYLIDDPVDVVGNIGSEDERSSRSTISVELTIGETEVPETLQKFINTVSDFGTITTKETPKNS